MNNILKLALIVDGILRILGIASFTLFIAAVYGISGRTFDIGLISLATFIPSVLVMVFSGRIFHKFNSNNILTALNLLRFFTYVFAGMFHNQIHVLYLAAAIHSLIHQVTMVAKMDIDANLVDEQTRVSYLSIKNLIANVVVVAGPPVGGGLLAWFGSKNAFFIMSIIALVLEIAILALNRACQNLHTANRFKATAAARTATAAATTTTTTTTTATSTNANTNTAVITKNSSDNDINMRDFELGKKLNPKLGLIETLKKLKQKPKALVTVFAYCLVAMILEMQAPLVFPFVKEVYNKGPDFASYLLGLAGLGGILGALLPKFYPKAVTAGIMPYLIIFDGFLFGVFTLIETPGIAIVLFAFLGILGSLTLIIVEAIVQIEVESEYRPQIYSIMQFAGGAGGASVGVVAAYAAEIYGTQKILTSAAGFEIICGILSAILFLSALKNNTVIKKNL